MDLWEELKKLAGYQSGNGGVDSYGVDHSGFSTRDELEYQNARLNRENQLAENFSKQGIAEENYPQFGTNFWGGSPDNNYGFGTSNISGNIENVTNQLNNNGFNSANNGQGFNANSINNMLNNYGYSGFGLQLQPDTLTAKGAQYAQMITPNTATDANNSQPVDYTLYGDGFSQEFIDQMLGDTDYQRALQEYAIPNEGGYVNNENDPGGETNMGISRRYHPNEDIPNLTRERANAILYNEIWNWNGINRLPREVRGFVFDHGIRTSPQNAIETTHRALGINPVGDIIGNTTLDRLQNIDYEEFLRRYPNLVREQDRNNRNYRHFGTGWNNRTDGYHISY